MSTITVIYKSGQKVHLKVKAFTARRVNGALVEVKWQEIDPLPLYFGVDDVAAIYEGKV